MRTGRGARVQSVRMCTCRVVPARSCLRTVGGVVRAVPFASCTRRLTGSGWMRSVCCLLAAEEPLVAALDSGWSSLVVSLIADGQAM